MQEQPSRQQLAYVKPEWKIWHSFMILLLAFLTGTVLYLLFGNTKNQGGFLLLLQVAQSACLFLAPVYVAGIRRRQPPQALGLRQKPFVLGLGKGMIWGVALFALNVLVSVLQVILFPGHTQEQQTVMQALQNVNGFEMTGLVICITVLAPISEEIFFRAFMLGALEARFGRWAGIIISSIVFGAMHESIWNFFPLFAGGCGFALLYTKYRNIYLNIIAHATWNSIAVLLMFASRSLA